MTVSMSRARSTSCWPTRGSGVIWAVTPAKQSDGVTGPFYEAATLILPLVFAIVCHEVAHGAMARLLGDRTAEEQGRLTLNPLPHIDPLGTVILPGLLALTHLPV